MSTILIVDDDDDIRFSLSLLVKKEGYDVSTAPSGKKALEILRTTIIDLILLDIGLPDTSGLQLINDIQNISPDSDVIMLTGLDDAKTAVEALKNGAIDYIVKPFELIEFRSILHRVMQTRLMSQKASLAEISSGVDSILGSSRAMQEVREQVSMAGEVSSPVLITGETGTGKEIIAQAIHDSGPKHRGVFVKVDCGTLSSNLIESELFGYQKGAFTDAQQSKKGLIEIAHGGTLFLDEIGNLPLEMQPKFLRLIEEGSFRKVGGLEDKKVQLRIIAATNINIQHEILQGAFREDLYYRLNVIPIILPPLHQRENDVIELADFFLHSLKNDLKKDISGFTKDAYNGLLAHHWPGNIRELKNLIEREVIFCKSKWLSIPSLAKSFHENYKDSPVEPLVSLREIEKNYIEKILSYTGGNKSEAARILQISRTTLRDKLTQN